MANDRFFSSNTISINSSRWLESITGISEFSATINGDDTYVANPKGFLARAWPKIRGVLISFASSLPGLAISLTPQWVSLHAIDELDKSATVDGFLQHAVKPFVWPDAAGYHASSVAISGSLQIGLTHDVPAKAG